MTLDPAQRQDGRDLVLDVALEGHARAQEVMRRTGRTMGCSTPTASFTAMRLEPASPKPGVSRRCGLPVS